MTKQEVKREQTLADMANKIAKLDKENEQLLKDKGDLEDKVKTLEKTIKGYKKIAKWCDNCEQIAELKAECDLAIEGRDVKIKELETRCNELFLQTCGQAEKIAELEAQIGKMKRCFNCKYHNKFVESKCDECEDYSKWEIKEK